MQLEAVASLTKILPHAPTRAALFCFSHIRWNSVMQRPQHMLTSAARSHDVYFFEEPLFEDVSTPGFRDSRPLAGVQVITPILPHGTPSSQSTIIQKGIVDQVFGANNVGQLVLWYYTPLALAFTAHLEFDVCIYDCMEEHSAVTDAPVERVEDERKLMARADLMFTGGQSIYEARRLQHNTIYYLPDGSNAAHFQSAGNSCADPVDQAAIPHPRVGFHGVIDRRLDLNLLREVAAKMPDVQFVMLGPVVNVDPAELPLGFNIHWLGQKPYGELPPYVRQWDVAWMPLATTKANRYVNPFQTSEFLAAGLPEVSTAVVDVVRTYAALDLVEIADGDDITEKLRDALPGPSDRLQKVRPAVPVTKSWDQVWAEMSYRFKSVVSRRPFAPLPLVA